MGIEIVIKIAAMGLLIAVINQILSKCGRDEYAMLVTLAGLLAIILMMLPYVSDLFSAVGALMDF